MGRHENAVMILPSKLVTLPKCVRLLEWVATAKVLRWTVLFFRNILTSDLLNEGGRFQIALYLSFERDLMALAKSCR